MSEEQKIDLSKIINRLELISNLISLEEEEEINRHISKLEKQSLPVELKNIIVLLKGKSYYKSLNAIKEFINQHYQISKFIDPELNALKLEIKSLETQLNILSNEKANLEKLIYEFGIKHNNELGELIIKILEFRREKAKGTPQEKETEDDYNSYFNEYESGKTKQVAILTNEEQKELKNKYRKASKLCHPDIVREEQKNSASKLFAELNTAYEENNLKRVNEILENLEVGNFFVSKSDAINENKILKVELEKLHLSILEIQKELQLIKASDNYGLIINISKWDEYFSDKKKKLQLQLKKYESGKL